MEILDKDEVLRRPKLPADARKFTVQGIWPDNKFTDKRGDQWVPVLFRAERHRQWVGRDGR